MHVFTKNVVYTLNIFMYDMKYNNINIYIYIYTCIYCMCVQLYIHNKYTQYTNICKIKLEAINRD